MSQTAAQTTTYSLQTRRGGNWISITRGTKQECEAERARRAASARRDADERAAFDASHRIIGGL